MKGQLNIYACQKCNGRVVTIDVDEGVTPFMMACRIAEGDHEIAEHNELALRIDIEPKCNGMMLSNFYRADPALLPTFEWYRPVGEELDKLDKITREEHVDRGGLLIRRKVSKP